MSTVRQITSVIQDSFKTIVLLGSLSLSVFCGGCAVNPETIRTGFISNRHDIFEENVNDAPIRAGDVSLNISSTILVTKVIYGSNMENNDAVKPFDIYVNIDGQSTIIKGQINNTKYAKDNDKNYIDLQCKYSKHVFLPHGLHVLNVAIPEDGLVIQKEVLLDGNNNSLIIKPTYWMKSRGRQIASTEAVKYYDKVKGIKLILNGEQI